MGVPIMTHVTSPEPAVLESPSGESWAEVRGQSVIVFIDPDRWVDMAWLEQLASASGADPAGLVGEKFSDMTVFKFPA